MLKKEEQYNKHLNLESVYFAQTLIPFLGETMSRIAIVAAVNNVNAIGKENQLMWDLPIDLAHFKDLTKGNVIIMGRKTYESIGRPLPDRVNVVLTKHKDFKCDDTVIIRNDLLPTIKEMCDSYPDKRVMIIGGSQLYADAMDAVNTLHITRVDANMEGHAYFPELDKEKWIISESKSNEPDRYNKYATVFETYHRKNY